jgi:hypothetical protein
VNITGNLSCKGVAANNFRLFQQTGPSNEVKFIALGLCLRYNFSIYGAVGLESDNISPFLE